MQNGASNTDRKPDLEYTIKKIGDISTLPAILNKILHATADPATGAEYLQHILKSDPALTAKTLKVANSAYYGASQKVITMKHAIVFLGFKTVKNLAIAASVCDMFKSHERINEYSREALWKHSVAVAICAKSIAQRSGLRSGEDIFTAGIMHDLGIIMEDQYLHQHFVRLLQEPQLAERNICAAEQSVFGFDHAKLGSMVAMQWKIPAELCRPIEFHHTPRLAPAAYQTTAAIVYLANVICNAKKIGYVIKDMIDTADLNLVLALLHFQKDDVALIVEELPGEMEKAHELLIL